MAIVRWEKRETVAIVSMDNGENRQNLEFANGMNRVFDEILADQAVKAVILASTDPKYWSLGVDIEWISGRMQEKDNESIKSFMYGMNAVFKKLLLFPVPVIAAIGGHAFGNGAILSCACDFRFMRGDRGYFCFPEVDLGIPFLPGMIAMIRKAIPEYKLNELKLTGKRAGAAELEASHIIEKISTDSEGLISDTFLFASTFHKKRGIFAEHKKRLHRHIIETMDGEDPEFIESLFLFVAD